MHRVLITGASGLLGRAVFSEFDSHPQWEACGLAFSRASGKLVKADLTDEQQMKKIIFDFKVGFHMGVGIRIWKILLGNDTI